MTVKELREQNKLSQTAFAKSVGVSTSLIGAVETGARPITDSLSAKIKEVYGVAVDTAVMVEKKVEAKVEEKKAEIKETAKEAAQKAEAKVEAKAEEKKAEVKKAVKASAKKAGEKVEAKVAEQKAEVKKAVKASVKKTETKAKSKVQQKKAEVKSSVKKTAKKVASVVLQSPLGGEITSEAILAKVPADAEKVYVRIDQNKAYWVKGENYGAVDLW